VTKDTPGTIATTSKDVLRKFIPEVFLKLRSTRQRLGAAAGKIYTNLVWRDALGMRGANQRQATPAARSFLFVCFGNIMRSAMAEFLMRQALSEAAGLGISLAEHRAKPLTREMVAQADCVFAMDFQNKAELLTLYPEAEEKIFMLSAYAEGPWQYREIPDPYLGNLETTRFCGQQLRTCIQNLISSTILSSTTPREQTVTGR
jgi:protein-tyrosine phosphatase